MLVRAPRKAGLLLVVRRHVAGRGASRGPRSGPDHRGVKRQRFHEPASTEYLEALRGYATQKSTPRVGSGKQSG
jgi:hypothetical protein